MTKQYKTLSWLVAAVVLLLVLAGCATSASLPPGTYTASINAEDYFPLPNYSSTDFETYIVGDWGITLDEEHHYVVTKDGDFLVAEGHCTMTEDQIVFTDEEGPWACTDPGDGDGTYKWSIDGQVLTLTTVEDQCPGRNYVFSTHPFSRQN